jgi:hypothetical protein
LHHVPKDAHDGQEAASVLSLVVKNKTMIVRSVALAQNKPATGGNAVLFGDLEKPPTLETDRKNLVAEWLVKEAAIIYGRYGAFGMKPLNITSVKE